MKDLLDLDSIMEELPGEDREEDGGEEESREGGAREVPLAAGPIGRALPDQVALFAEEYARHGDTLTQPQYAARFSCSDRQIRRWLADGRVQERIEELKRAARIDLSTIDQLTPAQLQELRARLDQLEGRPAETDWDPLLSQLRTRMMSLETNDLYEYYRALNEIIYDVFTHRKLRPSFRERGMAELRQIFNAIERNDEKLSREEHRKADILITAVLE